MSFPSAIGCFVIGQSPIGSGGPCLGTTAVTAQKTIPAYLYWEYRNDDNLQAFVDAYNALTQEFVDWFNNLNLPIYTGGVVSGALLDWVGSNLYGLPRPTLGSGSTRVLGPYNTAAYDVISYNARKLVGKFAGQLADDDLYRRIITWHFFKGDGKVFTVTWLKRRIMRFLTGENGLDPGIDQTYQISVSFGVCCQVNITLVTRRSRAYRGALYNAFSYAQTVPAGGGLPRGAPSTYNDTEVLVTSTGATQFSMAQVFKEAVEQGVLELPFQFSYVVNIQ